MRLVGHEISLSGQGCCDSGRSAEAHVLSARAAVSAHRGQRLSLITWPMRLGRRVKKIAQKQSQVMRLFGLLPKARAL